MTQVKSPSITGIYEVCIGVRDPLPQLQYWQQFGYRIGQIGQLALAEVKALYGVDSGLRSIRLYHQNADHGLVRLMVWENPTNEGLQMSSMRVKGNRWATTLTADLWTVLNHAEEAVPAGFPLKYVYPQWDVIYQKDRKGRPFIDPAIGVREMLLLQPLTRQVLFQRFNYTLPDYGTVDQNAAFKTSQITHTGMIIQDDRKETLQFYDQSLGLLRVRDDVETTYNSSSAGRQIFELQPQQRFWVTAFDDPRSSTTDLQAVRSGRLFIVRFPESLPLTESYTQAQPGCLGMSLYTYRVQGLTDYVQRVQAGGAQRITEIVMNEFGEPSFSFVAPDGYFWTLVSHSLIPDS